jgi:hypothetical protein
MLDRIAVNFAFLPSNYYSESILVLPAEEETSNEINNDYTELKSVLTKILETMKPGGKVGIGQPETDFTKDAILAGFLIESQNSQVSPPYSQLTSDNPN